MRLFTCLSMAMCHIGLAFCHQTYNEQATMSHSKDGFEASGLVPDLLPTFNPQGTLTIHFSDHEVLRHPGSHMSTGDTQTSPSFQFHPGVTGQLNSEEKFMLIMLDPDSPIHANPSGAKLHLLATGLTLDRHHEPIETYNLINNTRYLVDWNSPNPEARTGVHRYTFLLYKDVTSETSLKPFQAPGFNRSGFNLAQFTRAAGLQDSYAANFMNIDSTPTENAVRQNSQGNSLSAQLIDVYALSTTIALSFLGAIYFS